MLISCRTPHQMGGGGGGGGGGEGGKGLPEHSLSQHLGLRRKSLGNRLLAVQGHRRVELLVNQPLLLLLLSVILKQNN